MLEVRTPGVNPMKKFATRIRERLIGPSVNDVDWDALQSNYKWLMELKDLDRIPKWSKLRKELQFENVMSFAEKFKIRYGVNHELQVKGPENKRKRIEVQTEREEIDDDKEYTVRGIRLSDIMNNAFFKYNVLDVLFYEGEVNLEKVYEGVRFEYTLLGETHSVEVVHLVAAERVEITIDKEIKKYDLEGNII